MSSKYAMVQNLWSKVFEWEFIFHTTPVSHVKQCVPTNGICKMQCGNKWISRRLENLN
jgi:hypothetical protein